VRESIPNWKGVAAKQGIPLKQARRLERKTENRGTPLLIKQVYGTWITEGREEFVKGGMVEKVSKTSKHVRKEKPEHTPGRTVFKNLDLSWKHACQCASGGVRGGLNSKESGTYPPIGFHKKGTHDLQTPANYPGQEGNRNVRSGENTTGRFFLGKVVSGTVSFELI